jgi:hypothetical protein
LSKPIAEHSFSAILYLRMAFDIKKLDGVWITTWVGDPLADEVDQFFKEYNEILDECLRLNRKLLIINDFSNAHAPSPMVRKKVAEHFRESSVKRHVILQSLFVVNNPMVRGAVTAVTWFAPSMKTAAIVPTFEEACRRAINVLRQANLLIPFELHVEGQQ